MVGGVHEGQDGGMVGPTSGKKVVRMFAIGLGSGFLAGVFGVGGGVVTVPALSLATDLGHKEVSPIVCVIVGGSYWCRCCSLVLFFCVVVIVVVVAVVSVRIGG